VSTYDELARRDDNPVQWFMMNRAVKRSTREIYEEHAKTALKIKSTLAIGQCAYDAALEIVDYSIQELGSEPLPLSSVRGTPFSMLTSFFSATCWITRHMSAWASLRLAAS
jgi:hypothetical protein